jgi:hypothetical protein
MGLRSGGGVMIVVGSCGGGAVVEAMLDGGGGSVCGHTKDLVTGDPLSGSLLHDLGATVLVGLPCTLTWILAVCLGAGLGVELSTSMISMGSSSSATATPSPPSLGLGDEIYVRLDAIG